MKIRGLVWSGMGLLKQHGWWAGLHQGFGWKGAEVSADFSGNMSVDLCQMLGLSCLPDLCAQPPSRVAPSQPLNFLRRLKRSMKLIKEGHRRRWRRVWGRNYVNTVRMCGLLNHNKCLKVKKSHKTKINDAMSMKVPTTGISGRPLINSSFI